MQPLLIALTSHPHHRLLLSRIAKRICLPLEFRENSTVTLQQLLVGVVVLSDYAGCKSCFCNLLLHGLPDIEWPYIVGQASDGLVAAASEGPLDVVFLAVRVLVQHRGHVGHLVVPHGLLFALQLRLALRLQGDILVGLRIAVLIGVVALERMRCVIAAAVVAAHIFLHAVAQLLKLGRASRQRTRMFQFHFLF